MKTCKRCGGEFQWIKKGVAWVPSNADGRRHKCPPLLAAAPKPSKAGPRINGPLYQPSCGSCAIPPWESCACSKLLGIAA